MQLPQRLQMDDAAAVAGTLPAALATLAQGSALRIDASALQAFDTSTLAVLLQARRLAQAAGRSIEVTGAPPKLAELARLYGVAELVALA